MTKFDVALQYVEDKAESDGFLTASEIERMCTRLGLSFGDRIRIKHALEKKNIKINSLIGTGVDETSEQQKQIENRAAYHISRLKKNSVHEEQKLAAKTDSVQGVKFAGYDAHKIKEYSVKTSPSESVGKQDDYRNIGQKSARKQIEQKSNFSKENTVISSSSARYLSERKKKVTDKKNTAANHIGVAADNYSDQRQTAKLLSKPVERSDLTIDKNLESNLKAERMLRQIVHDYPCFKGLLSEGIFSSITKDSPARQFCGTFWAMSDEEKMKIKEALLYDVFLSAYRRAQRNSLDFEELLSEFWMEFSESIEKYNRRHKRSTIERYLNSRLNICIDAYKEKVSNEQNSNEIPIGLLEDMCLNNTLSDSFYLRKKTGFEILLTDIDRLFELCSIKDRNQEVLKMYFGFYGQPMTFEEIGKKFNVTRERIRQIYKKTMRMLRGRLRCISERGVIEVNGVDEEMTFLERCEYLSDRAMSEYFRNNSFQNTETD